MSGWLQAVRRWWSRAGRRTVDPVQQDRFALWVLDAGERTPEGAAVGTPLPEAWLMYPDAEPLSRDGAPALLARRRHRAYLLCHDGSRLTKIVAGGEEYVRSLYDVLPVP